MANKITQAVILSAGFGTRLREVTGEEIPKAMVPLAHKPILEHHIERLKNHGVNEIFINLHYLPEKITDYFGDGKKWGVKISYYLEESEILGTAGGIKDFEGKLKGDFFVIYADMFNEVDYTRMAKAFYEKPGAIGLELIGETVDPQHGDMVLVDSNMCFSKVFTRPHGELPKGVKKMKAIFIFNEKILSYIPPHKYFEIDKELLPLIMEKGEKIYGYESHDYIKDIGRPERYAEVQKYLLDK